MTNIKLDENINQLKTQISNLRDETLRLEGSLRMLIQLKDLGVSEIPINIMNSKEIVVDGHNRPKSENDGGPVIESEN